MKTLTTIILPGVAICLFAISLSSCDDITVRDLDPIEITEYEGENLSSINDFRENSIKGPQYIDSANYTLRINGLVETPLVLTYDEIINRYQSYRKVVTLNCVEGWSVKILWEGFLLRDLINEVNPSSNVTTVILRAYDGYSTSFPIEYIMNNDILVANKMNGITLPPERGFPFQLVAESKWGYKWIKWITSIEFSETDYYGYWETKGYSNEGNLDEYFYEWLD